MAIAGASGGAPTSAEIRAWRAAVDARRRTTATIQTPPRTTTTKTRTTSTSSSSRSRSSSGSSSRGSAPDPYAAALARQEAEAAKAKEKLAQRLEDQAKILMDQASALKIALGDSGYKARLNQQLKNIELVWKEADELLLKQYRTGHGALSDQADVNEESRQGGIVASLMNAGRERSAALSEAMANGSGETDLLRAQSASLRNWFFNTGEVQGDYVDTLTQLRSSASELHSSTLTARQSAFREAEADREQVTNAYYDNLSQVQTEIGNKLGEAASYWGMSAEQLSNTTRVNEQKRLKRESQQAFEEASRLTGKSYTQKDTPTGITEWKGNPEFENSTNAAAWVTQDLSMKTAEGATLRRWRA